MKNSLLNKLAYVKKILSVKLISSIMKSCQHYIISMLYKAVSKRQINRIKNLEKRLAPCSRKFDQCYGMLLRTFERNYHSSSVQFESVCHTSIRKSQYQRYLCTKDVEVEVVNFGTLWYQYKRIDVFVMYLMSSPLHV